MKETDLEALSNVHRAVARDMALGLTIEQSCSYRGLAVTRWQRIAQGELFKNEVLRMQRAIESEMIDEVVTDPVFKRLQAAAVGAVDTLVSETGNYDRESGGTGSSRIAAANSILEKLGYKGKEENKQVAIQINISSGEVPALQASIRSTDRPKVGDINGVMPGSAGAVPETVSSLALGGRPEAVPETEAPEQPEINIEPVDEEVSL